MYRDLGFSGNGLEVEGFRRGFWFGLGVWGCTGWSSCRFVGQGSF